MPLALIRRELSKLDLRSSGYVWCVYILYLNFKSCLYSKFTANFAYTHRITKASASLVDLLDLRTYIYYYCMCAGVGCGQWKGLPQ